MKQKKGIRLVMLSHLVKEDELEMQISTYFEFQMSNFQGQGQRNELVDWTWLSVALFNYWPWFLWSGEKKQFPSEVEPIQAF